MSSSKNAEELPPIQLVENWGWRMVEINGTEREIPEEWKNFNLGSVATFSKGKGLSKKALIENGSNECIHYGELFTKYGSSIDTIRSKTDTPTDNMALSKAGDILMPTSDVTPTGLATASSINQEGVILGGDILIIRPNLDEIHPPFLSRVIREEKSQVMGLVSGSTVYHIYAKDMKLFSLTLPPLPEQTLIAQVLTAQESQVHDLRKLAALERQRLSWLSDELLSGRLRVEEDPTAGSVVVSRNEKGEPVEVLPGMRVVRNREWKTVDLNGEEIRIPLEWEPESIQSLFDISMGVTILSKNTNPYRFPGSVPVYSATERNVAFGYIAESSIPDSKKLGAGDIVLGARGSLGFPKVVRSESTSTQTTIQMKTKNTCDSDFVSHFLNSNNKKIFGGSGSGVPMLTVRDVAEIQIPLPEKNEQTLIAQVLTAQETQASELERLADLEQKRLEWLSDELLSGRIRVRAVDAEDEQENTP